MRRPLGPQGLDGLMQQTLTAWQPANVAPPIRSQPITTLTPPTTVTDAAFITVFQRKVPSRMSLVIDQFGFSAESGAAEADVQWRVLRNGIPIPNLGGTLGPTGSTRDPVKVNWRFNERELAQIQFQGLTAGLPHDVQAYVRGWQFTPSYYSSASISPWSGR